MPSRIVIRRILLSTDQQLGMEKLSVITGTNLIDGTGIQVYEDRAGNVFAAAGLCEDGIELAALVEVFGCGVRATIFAEAVLEEVAGSIVRNC